MLIIPAVDLMEGGCVRLIQGKRENVIRYPGTPADVAAGWVAQGAKRVHFIDLDGAFGGAPAHLAELREVVRRVDVPVQFGGGVRDAAALADVLDAGAAFVILGTSALKNPDFLRRAAGENPGRVILGLDAKDGEVKVSGWEEGERVTPEEVAARFADLPLAGIIFTDIRRDGTLEGFDPGPILSLARAANVPVFAAGGVSRIADIEALIPLEKEGIAGAIVGRALYEGTLDLKAALELV
ncbi:MAG: 1-(5-phosphoribosyl)-5-[(5-phosphoribosylamino)methylideneamino]imidazole-4-carboxamide isomerase [bacterium]|nr:1-(5-phosphoribosyl)-5-[(5-phosphoribosylamino)methylideneamino]imidazole-4-carboxamide isomerase [bacterium]